MTLILFSEMYNQQNVFFLKRQAKDIKWILSILCILFLIIFYSYEILVSMHVIPINTTLLPGESLSTKSTYDIFFNEKWI